jgi:hypothetical protein
MASLDLVISVDTAVSHLSGALARRPPARLRSDFRWLIERTTRPGIRRAPLSPARAATGPVVAAVGASSDRSMSMRRQAGSGRPVRARSPHQAVAEALVDCEAALAEPADPALAADKHRLRASTEREALAALARAIQLEPRDTDLRLQRASLHLIAGNRADAVALTALLALDPGMSRRCAPCSVRQTGDLEGRSRARNPAAQAAHDARAWSQLGAAARALVPDMPRPAIAAPP